VNLISRVKIPAPITLVPAAPDLQETLEGLPRAAGIYSLGIGGRAPHLGSTANLARRLTRLLLPANAARASSLEALREKVAGIDCWPTGSRLESSLLLYHLARRYYPAEYVKRLRMRMPWFVGLTGKDPFPRLEIVNRISHAGGAAFGPFVSRDAADAYAQQILQLFQIRRCTDVLSPHPNHPGCIYGEMNQCLKPCQCAVTMEEYSTESGRVAEFLSTNGRSAVASLSVARDRASSEMDFEQAAQIHKRIEKAEAASVLRDAVIDDASEFSGVALTPAAGTLQFRLWPMLEGLWQESIVLDFSAETPQAKSLDQQIRELLAESLANPRTEGRRIEELAIFSRWYYSSWRDGHWFPFHRLGDLNYRRLVRQVSSMAKEKAR
jgi:excinuclease UvrABC nuclease subunit